MKGLIRTAFAMAPLAAVALAAAAPAAAQQLCVSASRANLRAGPGTDTRITWEVNRYMPLIQVAVEDDWIKVKDVDGDLHWIYAPLVTDEIACVTISAPQANIRKKPTTRSDKWFTVEKYTSFKRVGSHDKWVKVEYEGETMWIYNTLVWPR
jgi:SH3-like domain-containing protein